MALAQNEQQDDWTWSTLQYETGDHMGQYLIMSGGHNWEDFDAKAEFSNEDLAHYMATVSQYVESETGWYSRTRYDLSILPEGDAGPMPLARVTEYELNPGMGREFDRVMAKVAEACNKTNRPGYYFVVEGVSGANGPTRTIVGVEKDWAGFKPEDKPIREMMEEVYGELEWASLRETFWKAVRSSKTNFVRYRPDLSYQPSTT